jgi:hypothetical protein
MSTLNFAGTDGQIFFYRCFIVQLVKPVFSNSGEGSDRRIIFRYTLSFDKGFESLEHGFGLIGWKSELFALQPLGL